MATLEIQYRWTMAGVQQQSVHYFDGPTLDATDLAAAHQQVDNIYNVHLQSFLSTAWQVAPGQGRVVSTQGNPYTPIPITVWNGTGNLAVLPLGTTVLCTFYRNAPAPNTKRVYHTGFTVGNLVNGVPGNGLVTAVNAWADALLGIVFINAKPAFYAIGRMTGSPPYMPTAFDLETRNTSATFGHMESRER